MNTTFIHQVIKRHHLTGKRTIVKKFAFDDTVQAMNLERQLNAEHAADWVSFTVETVPARTKAGK